MDQMIQDIFPSCYQVAYQPRPPKPEDKCFFFRGRTVLERWDGEALVLPDYAAVAAHIGQPQFLFIIEDTVRREVMEEVGLQVKDLRYYGSQPWGADANLLLGFFARLDGPSAIHLDRQELSQAGWYHRDEIDLPSDGVSLTNHMIQAFRRGEWD